MCLFFESIKFLNCRPALLELHERRMNITRSHFFEKTGPVSLMPLLKNSNPALQKCKVIYNQDIISIEFSLYQARRINFLKIIDDDLIKYEFKYLDRKNLDDLVQDLPPESDILIVKNGMITDSSFANVVFRDGKTWLTPAEPLLAGTKRQYLLNEGRIKEEEIRVQDLHLFSAVKLINAMIDLDDPASIDPGNIY